MVRIARGVRRRAPPRCRASPRRTVRPWPAAGSPDPVPTSSAEPWRGGARRRPAGPRERGRAGCPDARASLRRARQRARRATRRARPRRSHPGHGEGSAAACPPAVRRSRRAAPPSATPRPPQDELAPAPLTPEPAAGVDLPGDAAESERAEARAHPRSRLGPRAPREETGRDVGAQEPGYRPGLLEQTRGRPQGGVARADHLVESIGVHAGHDELSSSSANTASGRALMVSRTSISCSGTASHLVSKGPAVRARSSGSGPRSTVRLGR